MKKISLISAVLMIVAIIITAFSFDTVQIPADNDKSKSNISTIRVYALNCKDCRKLSYCVDGAGPVVVGTCEFDIKCTEGEHTICVFCQGYEGGGGSPASFTCGGQVAVYVDCNIASANCLYCGNKKK